MYSMQRARSVPFFPVAPSTSLITARLMRDCLIIARMHLLAESEITCLHVS